VYLGGQQHSNHRDRSPRLTLGLRALFREFPGNAAIPLQPGIVPTNPPQYQSELEHANTVDLGASSPSLEGHLYLLDYSIGIH
jgi:hypothetical protein